RTSGNSSSIPSIAWSGAAPGLARASGWRSARASSPLWTDRSGSRTRRAAARRSRSPCRPPSPSPPSRPRRCRTRRGPEPGIPGRPPDAGRILVVDDEEQIRLALARALTARQYIVEARPEGDSALRTFDWFRPDLIVLDLNLPGMDGLEVCRRVRATSDVPI